MSNLDAFLETIATSEGTLKIPGGDRGYKVIAGSTAAKPILMDSYADHPRRKIKLSETLTSSAAGRYQILQRIYDDYRQILGLPDFSPDSQDRIAIQLIRECRALDDVVTGRFDSAAFKCRSRWASLPGAGYGQREQKLADLRQVFINSGGVVV